MVEDAGKPDDTMAERGGGAAVIRLDYVTATVSLETVRPPGELCGLSFSRHNQLLLLPKSRF